MLQFKVFNKSVPQCPSFAGHGCTPPPPSTPTHPTPPPPRHHLQAPTLTLPLLKKLGLMGIPSIENKSFRVSWFLGFFVSWFLGFLVSKVQSSKVPKFQRFKDSKIHFMCLKEIDPIFKRFENFNFMFSGRYSFHIQDFQEFPLRVFWKILIPCSSGLFRVPSFPTFSTVWSSKIWGFSKIRFVDMIWDFLEIFGVSRCLQR